MTLRHIKIFVSVCNHGSTTKAAQMMHIAQPSVSLAISELETYYGQTLFDRISNRLHITEAGKQFLQYASHIVSLFDEMEQGVRNWDLIGSMRIGASMTIGNCLLPDLVKDFQADFPSVKVRCVIENTENIEQRILKNDIDFGLVEGVVFSDYILTRPFRQDKLVFICAPGHPWAGKEVSTENLKQADLILREKGSAVREIIDRTFHTHGILTEPVWQSSSTQAIIRACGKGIGVSALPQLLVEDSIKRGDIATFAVDGISLVREFSIVYHKNKLLGAAAEAFIERCIG